MATIAPKRRVRSSHGLAFDYASTNRRIDADGRMHVSDCPITKATVNGYYGWEIPGYEELGLDPKKEYMLLRDPEELEKAAPLFDGVPLLDIHTPHDAKTTVKKNVAGAVGAGCSFDGEFILTPLLSIWGQADITAIEKEEKRELSASYGYDAVMKPGLFKGLRYDGRMVNITPNHVALVTRGRAGRDVLVMDGYPKGQKMKKRQFDQFARKARGLFANDADIDAEELVQLISLVAEAGSEGEEGEGGAEDDDNNDDPNAFDAELPEGAMAFLKDKLSDEELAEFSQCMKPDKAEDGEEDDGGEESGEGETDEEKAKKKAAKDKKAKDKKAMDAARQARPARRVVAMDAVAIRKQVVAEMSAWDRAREKVQPHIGRVKLAMDEVPGGAATLYRRALTAHNVPHARVMDINALEAMVDMIPAPSRPTLAHDAAQGETDPLDAILAGSVHVIRS